MHVRRVVTRNDTDGSAIVDTDEAVDGVTVQLLPGYEWHRLWGTDDVIEVPDGGQPSAELSSFPTTEGFRFGLLTIGPDSVAISDDIDVADALEELNRKLPGMGDNQETDDPSMHTTDTVDCLYVVSGRVVLDLDGGRTVELGPGDTLVQNGTRHAWRNPFDEPCQIVLTNLGASRTR